MVKEGFIKEETVQLLLNSDSIPKLLAKMKAFNYSETPKWIEKT